MSYGETWNTASTASRSKVIDLRSDTMTRPSPGMRQAIAAAEVGDDMSGEDPTVNRLEALMCTLAGKPAAVYACSGTQSNQMAIWAQCRPADELLIEESGHLANYEGGAPAALTGVTCRTIRGDDGLLDVCHLAGMVRPPTQHFAQTRLLCIENTANLGGGRAYPLEQIARLHAWSREQRIGVHIDGARLFNATIARGYSLKDVCSLADTVSICFSKGLGCPMGSILLGEVDVIQRARRARKLFGGALRQAGMMAAAAIYALEHHVAPLADDHAHAKRLAEGFASIPGIVIDPKSVETNLVFFQIDRHFGTAAQISAAFRECGVLINSLGGGQRMRACTHRDVSGDDVSAALDIVRRVMTERDQAAA